MIDLAAALRSQRVLVTGGAGVIARELLGLLSEAGADVLSIDRLPLPMATPAGVRHVLGDLAEMDLSVVADFQPRHVMHLAATFERSVESPEFWTQNWNDNVVVTHRLVELADRLAGLESFVFASSYLVYDPRLYSSLGVPTAATPLDEDIRIRPRNLCGAAKLFGEAEATFLEEVRRSSARVVFARIFRVYGRGSRDVVSRWVRAALAGEAIDVYHPENRFDYVYSGDVAEGLARLAATPGARGTVNLASGSARPVASVIEAIEAATGRGLERTTHAVDEPYEASQADLGRLEAAVGWRPQTTLEAGVRRLVEFELAGARKPRGAD